MAKDFNRPAHSSQRKLAEEELLRTGDVLQSVMDGAKRCHLVYLDRDFNFVRVNEEYAKTCGYRPAEMIGKNHFDLYPHPENEAIFSRVRDTGESFEAHDKPFEFPDQPERGVTYWDWTLSPVKDRTGEVIGLVLSLFETTSRKRAEESLRASEERFRLMFEDHSAIMFLIDPNNRRIIDANIAASEFYGYSREYLRQMTLDQINIASPGYLSESLSKATEGRENKFISSHRLADGTIRVMEVYATPISFRNQTLSFSIVHDITERKMAEDQLKALNKDLERMVEQRTNELLDTRQKFLHADKLAAIGKLSASISHEINNPLQGILTTLKGLRLILTMSDEDQKRFDTVVSECNRIRDLIRGLRDFHYPTPKKKIYLDLNRTLDALLALLKSDMDSRGISLRLLYDRQLPHVFAVNDQIKQVFLNLLTNAMEACNETGGVISVRTSRKGDKVAVVIEDNGVGIAPEAMEHIFQPFYTTKPQVKGVGLGLSITHGIVRSHGGDILVKSQREKGTTFTVLIPIKLHHA